MAIGLVELATARQPDHLLGTQVILQATRHFVLAQVGVAITIEQALLGGQQAALTIALDTAQLGNQRRAVTVEVFDFEDLLGNLIVLVPRIIETAIQPAVGIELEVDAAYFSAVIVNHKTSAAVAKPGVVAGHFHHPYLRG
ncbi:hypothetical protein D3C78_1399290 [compost metagenome]